MVGVTTVALIERKPDISRDLFTRYWRDVHGVMAARIPGFDSYTQHHVTPLGWPGLPPREPFEGIAIVTFASEADREGLGSSEITGHIHRDEQNVFRRALLYNLGPAGSRRDGAEPEGAVARRFFVIPDDLVPADGYAELRRGSAAATAFHDLRSGDPAAWNSTDVDDGGRGGRFSAVAEGVWPCAAAADEGARLTCERFGGVVGCYRVDESFVMVMDGRPTHLGLRGFDALRTIHEAGADNQLSSPVVAAIYGVRA